MFHQRNRKFQFVILREIGGYCKNHKRLLTFIEHNGKFAFLGGIFVGFVKVIRLINWLF